MKKRDHKKGYGSPFVFMFPLHYSIVGRERDAPRGRLSGAKAPYFLEVKDGAEEGLERRVGQKFLYIIHHQQI